MRPLLKSESNHISQEWEWICLKSWKSPNQSRAPGEKDGKDNIGHGGGDPDHLAAWFDALHVFDVGRAFSNTFMKTSCTLNKKQADAGDLEEGDVEEAVDHADADDQLPLG